MNRVFFLILAFLIAAGCNNGSLLEETPCLTSFKSHEGHDHDEETEEEEEEPSPSENGEVEESDPCAALHFSEPA